MRRMHNNEAKDDESKLLTTREVGQQLRCGEPTVRRLIRQRRLRALRVGKRLLVRETELKAYLVSASSTGVTE